MTSKELKQKIATLEKGLQTNAPADEKAMYQKALDSFKSKLAVLEASEANEHKAVILADKVQKTKTATAAEKKSAKEKVTASKAKTQKAKDKAVKEFKSLTALVKATPKLHGYKGTPEANLKRDAGRPAIKKIGKRLSADGNIYYEYRANRSDIQPDRKIMLESGGRLGKGRTGFFSETKYLPVEYAGTFTLKGNGRNKYNIKQGHDDSGFRQAARQLFPDHTYDQHQAAAGEYKQKFAAAKIAYSERLDQAAEETWGRPYEATDYKVSGIASDEFSDAAKEDLRTEILKMNEYGSAYLLHNSMLNKKDKFARGGKVKQNAPQSTSYDYRADKGEQAKPVGWRYTDAGAKRLRKSTNAKPTAAHILKYAGQTIPGSGGQRYLYSEARKDKSDVNQHKKPMLETGGALESGRLIPMHMHSGETVAVFGEHFDFAHCSTVSTAFKNAVATMEGKLLQDEPIFEHHKGFLIKTAHAVVEILAIEGRAVDAGRCSREDFIAAARAYGRAVLFNYQGGSRVDNLPRSLEKHIETIALLVK